MWVLIWGWDSAGMGGWYGLSLTSRSAYAACNAFVVWIAFGRGMLYDGGLLFLVVRLGVGDSGLGLLLGGHCGVD